MAKKFFSIFVFALSLLVIQAPVSYAGHCGCEAMANKMHAEIAKFDLSKEQKDKIKDVTEKTRETIKGKHDELRDIRMLINSSFKDDTMTETKVDEFVNKQTLVMGAIIKARMMQRLSISKILTPEQKMQVNKMMDKWMKEHAQNKGMCKGE